MKDGIVVKGTTADSACSLLGFVLGHFWQKAWCPAGPGTANKYWKQHILCTHWNIHPLEEIRNFDNYKDRDYEAVHEITGTHAYCKEFNESFLTCQDKHWLTTILMKHLSLTALHVSPECWNRMLTCTHEISLCNSTDACKHFIYFVTWHCLLVMSFNSECYLQVVNFWNAGFSFSCCTKEEQTRDLAPKAHVLHCYHCHTPQCSEGVAPSMGGGTFHGGWHIPGGGGVWLWS